jgi:N-methylhydantoinase A/oxoprolinase/acetone carboxylase beta subunit
MRIGVDTGGTFTDLVRFDAAGLTVHKVRSTPDDPSRAILQGLSDLGREAGTRDVVHGSTVATNAVLERTGARVALVATAGFEDVVRIGRQTRPALYDLMQPVPRPLVDPALTFGCPERLDADGQVLVPLDDAAIDDLVARVRASGATAVAVCGLHAYRNPMHEERLAAALEAAGLVVSASSRVLREYREYERWSTTIVDAYVRPLMDAYLGALETGLGGDRLAIMQSNGGTISAAAARGASVRTILSGPAAGVVGARAVAEAAGHPRVISFDMGGTSTDACLIDAAIPTTPESKVGDFPIRLPVIDIHTVGAGGGSIAFVDSGGALRVGPRSAGAVPGPACYGAGDALTVTDANLLLGRLDPDFFLGGRMALDVERSRRAARALAPRLGLSEAALAEGVVRIANANMERAIRVVSVQRGHDPRQFALLAFGGAGGMHACAIAAALDIATVIVPRHAGVLSALGMLLADVVKDYALTVLRPGDSLAAGELDALFAPLAAQAMADLAREGFAADRVDLERTLDIRYAGQSYEIGVPAADGFRDAFDRRHARAYGYADPRRAIEIVTLRVVAAGRTAKPALPRTPPAGDPSTATPSRVREARFDGRLVATACYRWDDLPPGAAAEGPAIVASGEATAVVPPGFRFHVDDRRNLVATRVPVPVAPRRRRAAVARSA